MRSIPWPTPPSLTAPRRLVASALVGLSLATALVLSTPAPASAGGASTVPPDHAVTTAIDSVAARPGTDATRVSLVRAVRVTWDDICLGVRSSSAGCAALEREYDDLAERVEGWVLWIAAEGRGYRFHADGDGSRVVLAGDRMAAAAVATEPLPRGALAFAPGATPGASTIAAPGARGGPGGGPDGEPSAVSRWFGLLLSQPEDAAADSGSAAAAAEVTQAAQEAVETQVAQAPGDGDPGGRSDLALALVLMTLLAATTLGARRFDDRRSGRPDEA